MTSTRRHKIARSAVIRRVKSRKSEKAKRPKVKTFRRKSRNNVMRGGIHKDLKVYVIQKKLGKPKCYIIREVSLGLDTIYMFFDNQLPDEELKTFLCGALNLNNLDSLQPQLTIPKEIDDKAFKSLFVKLSGFRSYTLSSGKLPQNKNFPLSKVVVTKHTPDFNIGNGEAVIQRVKTKTEDSFTDYTFTEKTPEELKYDFRSFDFTLSNLNTLFEDIIEFTTKAVTTFCDKSEIMEKVNQLKELIARQQRLKLFADNFANSFANGYRVKDSKDDDKNYFIGEAKKRIPFTAEDITKAGNLIQEIKANPNYQTCNGIINSDYRTSLYFTGYFKFKTIEEIFDDAYTSI